MDVDERLVRRLEASAAATTLQLVDAMRALDAGHPARGQVMFDGALIVTGAGRYVNRGLGVTLDDRSSEDINSIEQFFGDQGLPATVELSSWSSPATIAELSRRDFRPAWFRSMFVIDPVGRHAPMAPDVHIEQVDDSNAELWMDTHATGFEVADGGPRSISDEFALATHSSPDASIVLAMVDGQPAGCGSVHVANGVAWLGGAATVPAYRRHGVQATLVADRLRMALDRGCDVAAATAVPSGASARNLIRLGFQLVQTQVVVEQSAAGQR